jgi:hypothetical protein
MISLATVAWFLFETKLGKIAAVGALGSGLFFGWLLSHDVKVAKKAEQKVITRSVDAGKKANAKNDAVRRDASKPGAAKRLLNDACRDC